MAEHQLSRDLGLSATAYALGAGIFFIGYALFEIPSNLILARVGARRWIARIAITWGLVTSAMMFVRTPGQLYMLRFVLGVAEAGVMPGVIYYLMLWYPARERGMATARFMLATTLAGVGGNPLGGSILGFDGRLGLHGWQWLFLVEGIPSVMSGPSHKRGQRTRKGTVTVSGGRRGTDPITRNARSPGPAGRYAKS
jgi:MFS family permease